MLFGKVRFKIISCFYYVFIQFNVFYEVIKIFTLLIIIFNNLLKLKDYTTTAVRKHLSMVILEHIGKSF